METYMNRHVNDVLDVKTCWAFEDAGYDVKIMTCSDHEILAIDTDAGDDSKTVAIYMREYRHGVISNWELVKGQVIEDIQNVLL